jgi:predicted transcriptional regulator YdeE
MSNPLTYRTEYLAGLRICGLSVALTRSQSANAGTCQRFWKTFNQALAANRLEQGKGWVKYAITYDDDEVYRYLCGIPARSAVPDGFQTILVPASHYLVFEHRGPTRGIAETLSAIYCDFLPYSQYKHERSHLCHFERYDHRFRWNHATSLIEIRLPISPP